MWQQQVQSMVTKGGGGGGYNWAEEMSRFIYSLIFQPCSVYLLPESVLARSCDFF